MKKMCLTAKNNLKFLVFALLFIPSVLAQELPFGISSELPIPLLGIILGFVDGALNPCALSVLLFLIAYLLALGSRKKCLTIGLAYSLIIFLVYFSFMYGVLNLISIIGYFSLIKVAIGSIIIIAGMIMLKDFFFYGRWFSLEIPKSAKPKIEKLVKAATLPSAILLGFFVSLVEIPCAGAFPLLYLAILAERVSGTMNLIYLLLYNLSFVLPLVALTFVFYFGLLKVEEAEKKRLKLRKYMRLVAGAIMLSLGVAILARVI